MYMCKRTRRSIEGTERGTPGKGFRAWKGRGRALRIGTEGGRACVHGVSWKRSCTREGAFHSFRGRSTGHHASDRAPCDELQTPHLSASRSWETGPSSEWARDAWRGWLHEHLHPALSFFHPFHPIVLVLLVPAKSTRRSRPPPRDGSKGSFRRVRLPFGKGHRPGPIPTRSPIEPNLDWKHRSDRRKPRGPSGSLPPSESSTLHHAIFPALRSLPLHASPPFSVPAEDPDKARIRPSGYVPGRFGGEPSRTDAVRTCERAVRVAQSVLHLFVAHVRLLLHLFVACDVHWDHGCTCVRQACERRPRRGQESAQERVEVGPNEGWTRREDDGGG